MYHKVGPKDTAPVAKRAFQLQGFGKPGNCKYLIHRKLIFNPTEMKSFLLNKPILAFVLITFGITFSLWFAPAVFDIPKDLTLGLLILGGSGPLIAGYLLTLLRSGAPIRIGSKAVFALVFLGAGTVLFLRMTWSARIDSQTNMIPGIEEVSPTGYLLFALGIFVLALNASNATRLNLKENYLKSFIWDKGKWKWYAIALLLFPAMALLSYVLGGMLDMERSDFAINPDPLILIGFFSTFFFFGGNEEFGWRGFLQKELQKGLNPLWSALIISFLWSLWHLPMHYNGFYSDGGFADLLPRFLFTIPLTLVFSWLYNRSSYSILAVVILHACFNNFSKAFGDSGTIFAVLGIAFSIYCFVDDKMWKKRSFQKLYEAKTPA